MDLGLKGRNVIVTGGSRGIGFGMAEAFAREGANVAICGRTASSLDQAQESLGAHGTQIIALPCDVGDPAALKAFIEGAAEAMGGLHVMVNNPSGFGRTDDEEGWQAGLDIDLMALVRAGWTAVPLIEKSGGGSLIHISSISGLMASGRTPPYGAVKAAVIQYTKTQAVELAPKNIRVNCIAPGSIEFPGGVWDMARQNNPTLYKGILASIPHGRMGRADEVGKLAAFLGSDAASWVTGQTIAADGGQMLS
ncbi:MULTISPECIES: SDR family NAD(P)-dependent oxidoreductase [unclassified Minwuia]|jgi:NAD(P)-dependent dehydrogenase (short-subunit alcohol dehydrogenase family)|uniref:SDR family NAD(P)-dependent oxidoreductase n=1 Tax=unclassified Minwuia TaxID=2618799 RepID=UPI0024790107|nr:MULTISPECIES: SDR family NAD(P)-dependent oxidoreductase [unclassified Minwuia]